jgi:uncharacterized protein YjbI with pentapeptide repeats
VRKETNIKLQITPPKKKESKMAEVLKLQEQRLILEATQSNLTGSSFIDVNLAGTTFRDVSLDGSTLQNVNLSGLCIRDANLRGASISDSATEGMTVQGIPLADLLAAYRTLHPDA